MTDLPRLRRRFRKGRKPADEVICRCEAYKYPHRFGGGYCDGSSLVTFFWEKGKCGDCRFKDLDSFTGTPSCQVLNGQDEIIYCEQLHEFLRANEAYSKKLSNK